MAISHYILCVVVIVVVVVAAAAWSSRNIHERKINFKCADLYHLVDSYPHDSLGASSAGAVGPHPFLLAIEALVALTAVCVLETVPVPTASVLANARGSGTPLVGHKRVVIALVICGSRCGS